MAQLMCAQPETALEVDLIILDFLTFQASNGLFREYALRSNSAQVADFDSRIAENDLRLAHSFSDLFLYNHPDTAMPAIMSFRFNLMRSLELFVRQASQINYVKVEALLRLFVDCVDAGFTLNDTTTSERLNDLTLEQLQVASEETLVELLTMLHEAFPMPILMQLENGRVDGLTTEQTAELKKKVGWPSRT